DDDGGGHGHDSWGWARQSPRAKDLTGWSSVPRMSALRKPGRPAVRRVEGVTTLAAALSRAASSALDPTSVLQRTVEVLAPELPLAGVHLWRVGGDGPTLVASHP